MCWLALLHAAVAAGVMAPSSSVLHTVSCSLALGALRNCQVKQVSVTSIAAETCYEGKVVAEQQ